MKKLLLLLLVPGVLRAASYDGLGPSEKQKLMEQNYARAISYFNEANYSKAIQLWRDAFERDCTALPLLQNLANAYEKAGNIDGAIVTLETFIKRDPQNPDVPTIQKRIDNMKKARASAPPATTTITSGTAPRR